MLRLILYACSAFLFLCPGVTLADLITFAVTIPGQFGSLDLGTGAFTAIGGVHAGGYDGLGNLADGTLVAVDGDNKFVRIDRNTGAVTTIGPTGIIVTASASLLTGEQFAIDTLNRLYRINPGTGAATLVGATGIPGITNLNSFANALAGDATSLYYIFEQPGSPAIASTLYRIDPTTGVATVVDPTGTNGLVGAGFADGTLFAYSGSRIFTIDLATGAATAGPTYSGAFFISGSNSGAAVPEPGAWMLLGLGALGLLGHAWRWRRQAVA